MRYVEITCTVTDVADDATVTVNVNNWLDADGCDTPDDFEVELTRSDMTLPNWTKLSKAEPDDELTITVTYDSVSAYI